MAAPAFHTHNIVNEYNNIMYYSGIHVRWNMCYCIYYWFWNLHRKCLVESCTLKSLKSFLFYNKYFYLNILRNWTTVCRSSHQGCSVKKGVPRNFTKFAGKHLCQSLYFNKVFLWCFPVNFVKFLRTPFLQNMSGRLVLFLLLLFCCPHS